MAVAAVAAAAARTSVARHARPLGADTDAVLAELLP